MVPSSCYGPPWWLEASHFVGSVLVSLLIIATIECFIQGDNATRRQVGLPPRPRVWILVGLHGWKEASRPEWIMSIGLFFLYWIAGAIVGYLLSLVLNPVLMAVMIYLGFTLGVDFAVPWELSIVIMPVIVGGYWVLRDRLLRKRWVTWWEARERAITENTTPSNRGRPASGSK